MKYVLVFIVSIIFLDNTYSQDTWLPNDTVNYPTFTTLKVIDTSIIPDYYIVEIGVSNYYKSLKQGRRYISENIELDSVIEILKVALKEMSIEDELKLLSMSERATKDYFNKTLIQKTFQIKISTKDSVELLVEHLMEAMPSYSLASVFGYPELHKSTLKIVEDDLEEQLYNQFNIEAIEFASKQNLLVKGVETYYKYFTKKIDYSYNYNIYSGQTKQYNISYVHPVYTLSVTYVAKLE